MATWRLLTTLTRAVECGMDSSWPKCVEVCIGHEEMVMPSQFTKYPSLKKKKKQLNIFGYFIKSVYDSIENANKLN